MSQRFTALNQPLSLNREPVSNPHPCPTQVDLQTRPTSSSLPLVDSTDLRQLSYHRSFFQDQCLQPSHDRKDSATPLLVNDTRAPTSDSGQPHQSREMAVPMMPQRHMYGTLGSNYPSYQSRSSFYAPSSQLQLPQTDTYQVQSNPGYSAADYSQYAASQNLAYNYQATSQNAFQSTATVGHGMYMSSEVPADSTHLQASDSRSQAMIHTRYDSVTLPDAARYVPSQLPLAHFKPITASLQSSRSETNASVPGPIPATTPLVVRQDQNGVQWIAFQYSKDRVKMEYTIRCDVESIDIELLEEDFRNANCVYPRACGTMRSEYKGNRLQYETECNHVGWALARLNPELREKRGLIQRAVDSWRNSNSDEKLRSRRVRRMHKTSTRRSRLSASSFGAGLWRMSSLSDAASPGPPITRSPSLNTMSDDCTREHRHSDTSIDYTSSSHGAGNIYNVV